MALNKILLSLTIHPKVGNEGSCTYTQPKDVCPSMSRMNTSMHLNYAPKRGTTMFMT